MAPPTLRTERLVLRPNHAQDLELLAAIWADPNVTRHIGQPRAAADVWLRLLAAIGHWDTLGFGYWAIERDGALIGQAGFADFKRPLSPALCAPEAGWVFAAHAWGQGYATELLAALTAWADERGWPLTQAIISPENLASVRAAQRAGYRYSHEARSPEGSTIGVYARPQG